MTGAYELPEMAFVPGPRPMTVAAALAAVRALMQPASPAPRSRAVRRAPLLEMFAAQPTVTAAGGCLPPRRGGSHQSVDPHRGGRGRPDHRRAGQVGGPSFALPVDAGGGPLPSVRVSDAPVSRGDHRPGGRHVGSAGDVRRWAWGPFAGVVRVAAGGSGNEDGFGWCGVAVVAVGAAAVGGRVCAAVRRRVRRVVVVADAPVVVT